MFTLRAHVTHLDGQATIDDAVKAAQKVGRPIAQSVAQEQREAILSSTTPAGDPQKPNSPGYAASKKFSWRGAIHRDVPLYRTGRLATQSAWRVQRTKTGLVLRPPADRMKAVAILSNLGWKFVTNEAIPGLEERVLSRLKAELAKLKPKLKRRRTIGRA